MNGKRTPTVIEGCNPTITVPPTQLGKTLAEVLVTNILSYTLILVYIPVSFKKKIKGIVSQLVREIVPFSCSQKGEINNGKNDSITLQL
ncbi:MULTISPECIES: hypothetical protein [Bacillati]|uniref:hypothetical protein n=1 Tax=Bacillati TaxID=1783272 RepID=UPI0035DAF1B5